MDAPGVGLEATEAGKHQDSEEESQHGQAQSGVCDQGKCFQIPLQLLLMRQGGRERDQYYWIYKIQVGVNEKERGQVGSSCRERKRQKNVEAKQTQVSTQQARGERHITPKCSDFTER